MSDRVGVGRAMKSVQTNVVLYDMNKKVYKLNSHALAVALKEYEPIIRK